jgi:MFS transporter, DHA1 family, multidrug resistance protein
MVSSSMQITSKLTHTASASQIGVVTLLTNTCLMNFGFSMFVPLIAIHFSHSLGFTAAAIGLVLALRQIAQQGLDLAGGVFADHFGARTAIVIGCFVRAAGFVGIGVSTTLPMLILWAVVSGVGGAFFDASGTAALADLVAPERRQRMFAASATMGNAGQTIGPLLGVALLGINFVVVSLAAAGCFVLVGALSFAFLPNTLLRGGPATDRERTADLAGVSGVSGVLATLRTLWRDRTFVLLTLLLAGFWFLWAQLNIAVPLAAVRIGGPSFGATLAGLAFAINAAPAILIQYPLARYVGERYTPRVVLAASVALSGAGMALVFVTPSIAIFVVGIAVFALARMLVWPTVNAVTADLAPAHMLGAYFGFGALAVAIGAGLGQFLGGLLFDIATASRQPAVLWAPILLIALAAAYGLSRLRLPTRAATMPEREPVQPAVKNTR